MSMVGLNLTRDSHTKPMSAPVARDRESSMLKRVGLFLATNLAVLVLVSIVMSVFKVDPQQFTGLLVMAAVFGFGGSLVSLLMSKWVAKHFTGAQVIAQPRNEAEQWLVSTVQRQAQKAGIGFEVTDLVVADVELGKAAADFGGVQQFVGDAELSRRSHRVGEKPFHVGCGARRIA